MKLRMAGWAGLCLTVAAGSVWACDVPVFRYALERWPPEPHMVLVAPGTPVNMENASIWEMHANYWLEWADSNQTAEVRIVYPRSEEAWYEGKWDAGLLARVSDSPLRRRIAHELVTGTTASWILLESDNEARNAEVYTGMTQTLAQVQAMIEFPPEASDFGEDAGEEGRDICAIPLRANFSVHRLSRNDAAETFLVRQIERLTPDFLKPSEPVAVAVFGRGRMIPLAGRGLNGDGIADLCGFLAGPCSCTVKDMNPGVDLLMAANWGEAVATYPAIVKVRLPGGAEFAIGGTNGLPPAVAAGGGVSSAPEDAKGGACSSCSRSALPVAIVAIAAIVAGLALRTRLRKR